ncbi:four-carbon acid sugar kinase family protein [Belliella sp. DSM 111904]|uniref:Four-carbon acid sugar kinase family protein n=1 Tax=Belliella filtrata TaxID=2923435 RepID=A0ABS9UVB3_9BACT|nr:four-carbon acid sugar kinase family protein [Belliella filtrata]MCH7408107.1 four-carbon acid sugar kinase family protein [Belliella filtrata]
MREQENKLKIAFYGDDFTGSTDALEFLAKAGIRTVLFISPPSQEVLNQYPDIQAFGVAGLSRSLSPEEMVNELGDAFFALRDSNASHVHYKVCSTFDSSPTIGSIGKAIEIGFDIFDIDFVSLLVAAPLLGRYCAFGNLFAKMGIGSEGLIYRLDRHPSMSKHPTTPADESDLKRHLSKQTNIKIGLVDLLDIDQDRIEDQLLLELNAGCEIVLFDAVYQEHIKKIGEFLVKRGSDKQHFSVGSSGIEMALGEAYGLKKQLWENPGQSKNLLVLSGSCSPITAGQIKMGLENDFEEIAIDTVEIANQSESVSLDAYLKKAIKVFESGKNLIIHTAIGYDDPRVADTKEALKKQGYSEVEISRFTAKRYGSVMGLLAKAILARTQIQRMVIAGGDTSSWIARALGIESVEMIAPLAPGAPLCKASAPNSPADGLEINFKGGQVGKEDYFVKVQLGKMDAT